MTKRIGVLIGRFQGYHLAHHEHLSKAALANDLLVVLIGSRNKRCSLQNPWSADERAEMIQANIDADPELASCRIVFRYLNDHPDNQVWAQNARHSVNNFVSGDSVVTLYGTDKDASSFYLSLFPEWDKKLTPIINNYNATDLRKHWFQQAQTVMGMMGNINIPTATIKWLAQQKFNPNLHDEWNKLLSEKAKFANYPYPNCLNFACGDAVVVCHGMVLMGRRKHNPGKDCLALPGGHKESDETTFQTAVRELYEETTLEIPEEHLKLCEVRRMYFDNPNRSYGFTRTTQAVLFDVSRYYMEGEIPKTVAADDLVETLWVNIKDLTHLRNIHDDHAAIVLTITQ